MTDQVFSRANCDVRLCVEENRKLGARLGPQMGEGHRRRSLGVNKTQVNLGLQRHFAFAARSLVLLGIKSLFGKSDSSNI